MIKKTNDPYQYTMHKKSDNDWSRARQQQKRDAFVWKVGIFVITVISMVGCYAIYWASTL